MAGLFKRIFGDANQRTIARLQKTAEYINSLESQFQALSNDALCAKTDEFRQRLADGTPLNELMPEAFAAVREASVRTTGMRHYDVQLIGGMLLHEGQVAEMRTGEGKTLVATLPLYLNALSDQGAHLVTPNDYLAKVGVQWMGPIYHLLGITVSVIQSGAGRPDDASFQYDPDYASTDDRFQYLRPILRREAYRCDITYGTNNEFGFDYLRDNMVIAPEQCTQRDLHYAIVDEVDSILIDEARTPLIISGPADAPSPYYQQFARLVLSLNAEQDYEVDERAQIATLTEDGVAKVESMLGITGEESLYDATHAEVLPYLDNALRAKQFFHRDKSYVVRDGDEGKEIVIVDEFTGRLMFGRRYSEGLHQAIEAKENVKVRRESLTYATITFQNFFRMYDKLAGMTGTAETEKEELHRIYSLDVSVLPTNVEYRATYGNLTSKVILPEESGVSFAGAFANDAISFSTIKVTVYDQPDGKRYYKRLDLPDQIFKTEVAKFEAVVQEIKAAHEAGRPVLVGTAAIETSERLAKLLKKQRVTFEVLNAKYHEREAIIIAQAGRLGAVTIATNMAGRGVDILLGGNSEGLAREQLRKKQVDLTAIRSEDWESVLKAAQDGKPLPEAFAEALWADTLHKQVLACQEERDKVYALGGLHVIGTERHEARRIDNQLRGRAGRQGDPGSSRFYLALDDELMRRFGGERLAPFIERAWVEDAAIESPALGRVLGTIQQQVEGHNFDIRKHVLEYDDVVNKQREVVYAERRKALERGDLHDDLMDMVTAEFRSIINTHEYDIGMIIAEIQRIFPTLPQQDSDELQGMDAEELVEHFVNLADQAYIELNQSIGEERFRQLRQEEITLKALAESRDPVSNQIYQRFRQKHGDVVEKWYDQPVRRLPGEIEQSFLETFVNVLRMFNDRNIIVRQIDSHWQRHLTSLSMLREGIGLRAIGNQNPLVSYQKEAFEMYQIMMTSIQENIIRRLFFDPRKLAERRKRQRSVPQQRLTFSSSGASRGTTKARPVKSVRKPGRNDPCWCGSGKKYKNCHLKEDMQKNTG